MEDRDGLKMYVQFYANYGQLEQVEQRTGVPLRRLQTWLDGGILSDADRALLYEGAGPRTKSLVDVE